jgi:hypothetical protein
VLEFKKSPELKSLQYDSSIEALRKLVEDNGTEIVKISPRGYKMANGIDYCSVGLKSTDGDYYSIKAYGNEAIELHDLASMIMLTPTILESK